MDSIKNDYILIGVKNGRALKYQCSSNLNTSSTSRLKYAAIRSINSADGARSPRSTLLIVFVQNPVAEAKSSWRRPRSSRISLRLLTTAIVNTYFHTFFITKDTKNVVLKYGLVYCRKSLSSFG